MANRVEILEAELNAIIFWDRLYRDNPAPDSMEKDACMTRVFRRVQVIAELNQLAGGKIPEADKTPTGTGKLV